ncbi:MAG: hypothetical protein WD036_00010 [Bauldia sp.]
MATAAEPQDTARYIDSLAKELRALAASQNLSFLAYLLAMVADEAEAAVRGLNQEEAEAGGARGSGRRQA